MSIFYWCSISLLLFFAGLQWNDPDALLWMGLYIFPASICFLEYKRRGMYPFRILLIWGGIASYLGIFLYHLPYSIEKLSNAPIHIEEFREAMGALICLGILTACVIITRSFPKVSSKSPQKSSEPAGSTSSFS